jgi:large subunit ribosomal protein L13
VALGQKLTHSFKETEVPKKWYLVDAADQTLGRLASRTAHILRGKHKPTYTPHTDCGDFVIVVNAEKIRVTGKREELKTYFRHTGYPGGATVRTFQDVMRKNPSEVVSHAVKGMIPHNRLGARLVRKLKVYNGAEHPHVAQKPETITF